MNSKIFILKISDIMELGCRFLVQYICRDMLIDGYEVFCPSVPVCSKIVDGGARRRRRAVYQHYDTWYLILLYNTCILYLCICYLLLVLKYIKYVCLYTDVLMY